MEKRQRQRVLKKSQRQEKRTARSLGATQHSGSGNGWLHKNDSRTERLLIENKTVAGNKQITIKMADLEDLRRNAARKGREPVLAFELDGRDYGIVPWYYIEAAEEAFESDDEPTETG